MAQISRHGREAPSGLHDPVLHGNSRYSRLFPQCSGLRVPIDVLGKIASSMVDFNPPEPNPGGWQPLNPDNETDEGDNPSIPAGFTYLGQFIDHDVTLDASSKLLESTPVEHLSNRRTPRLDLDSVFRVNPDVSPWLYDAEQYGRLIVGDSDGTTDLQRNGQDVALIGDPRNDENRIISQLHLGIVQHYNTVWDEVGETADPKDRYVFARLEATWTYQWIVVHDFMRRICGDALVDEMLSVGPMCFKWPFQTTMPLEFSVAAFRFGHSMVRPRYGLTVGGTELEIFSEDGDDLRGGRPLSSGHEIEWSAFFETDSASPPQASRKIDTKLAPALFRLFGHGAVETPPNDSLALRNLARGVTLGLPSYEAIHRAMANDLTDQNHRVPVGDAHAFDLTEFGWGGETPLWFGLLKEAELAGGTRLGPVGARIVAEVLFGLLEGDPASFLRAQPTWQPSGKKTAALLLTASG